MTPLERHVEAIVGPLRASETRKDRIREELLAHLELAVEDERDRRSADPAGAALSRFGSIDAVRAGIQDSVPPWEQWLWSPVRVMAPIDRLFRFDPVRDRTAIRFAARRTASMLVLLVAVVVVALAAANQLEPFPARNGSRVDGEVLAIFLSLAASTFFSFYVAERAGLRAKLDLRHECSTAASMISLAVFGALWGGSFLVTVALALDDLRFLAQWVGSWSWAGSLLVLAAASFGAWFTARETAVAKDRFRRWGAPTD